VSPPRLNVQANEFTVACEQSKATRLGINKA